MITTSIPTNTDTTKKATKTLNIVIFGATGGTGRSLVEQALAEGHRVLAFDRNMDALTIEHPNLSTVKGDVFDPAQVEAAIAGQDVVISVLGVPPGVTIPVCSKGTENILAAMKKTGVKRFICQSAFVVAALDGQRREVPWILPLLLVCSPKNKIMFGDKLIQERLIKTSDLDWIIVRPGQLTNTPTTGQYKAGVSLKFGLRSHISRADVADFILKQASDDAYLRQTVGLHY